jgi:hypothetical protein
VVPPPPCSCSKWRRAFGPRVLVRAPCARQSSATPKPSKIAPPPSWIGPRIRRSLRGRRAGQTGGTRPNAVAVLLCRWPAARALWRQHYFSPRNPVSRLRSARLEQHDGLLRGMVTVQAADLTKKVGRLSAAGPTRYAEEEWGVPSAKPRWVRTPFERLAWIVYAWMAGTELAPRKQS